MSILKRFSTNISDAIAFGPQFLRRHLPKITGAELAEIKVSKNQRMFVRAGESDSAAIRQTFKDRQYRIDFNAQCLARIQRRYESILANGATPIIVDAGANIGAASIWFSIHFPKATIIGIEPEPGNFSVFQKNAGLVPNVKAVRAAIGAQAGFVKVVNDGLGWAARTERSCDGTRIMTMAEAFGMGVPFIAKIDIEGFESDLFSANTQWLADTFVVFIEPHDWLLPGKCTSRSFQAAMGKEDYEIYLSGEILTYVRREG